MTTRSLYLDGRYLIKNPTWHAEESAWKALQILRMLRRNRISPSNVCEVGCGAGEVLKQIQPQLAGSYSLGIRHLASSDRVSQEPGQ